jgi:hypothetical protein
VALPCPNSLEILLNHHFLLNFLALFAWERAAIQKLIAQLEEPSRRGRLGPTVDDG